MTLAIRATPQSKSLDKVCVSSEDLGRVSKDAGKGSNSIRCSYYCRQGGYTLNRARKGLNEF